MALIDKSRGAGKTFPRNLKLEVGQTVTGYVTGFEESSKYPGSHFILIRQENGETVSVSANGNLRYRHQDGDITVGQLTTITRNADRKGKSGKMVNDYYFAQDPEKTIEVAGEVDELTAAGIVSDIPTIKKSNVAAKAAALAKQVNK
jgi:hypothetical protein